MLSGKQVAGPGKVQCKWLFLSTRAFMQGFPADSNPPRHPFGVNKKAPLCACQLSRSGTHSQSPALLPQVLYWQGAPHRAGIKGRDQGSCPWDKMEEASQELNNPDKSNLMSLFKHDEPNIKPCCMEILFSLASAFLAPCTLCPHPKVSFTCLTLVLALGGTRWVWNRGRKGVHQALRDLAAGKLFYTLVLADEEMLKNTSRSISNCC